MDYNPISNRIRKLFLPDVLCENTDVNIVGEDISVCSIGGGPGYDHLSLCILASFLRHIQSSVNENSFRTRVVRKRAFDLFDDDWKNFMELLGISVRNALSKFTEELNSKDEIRNEVEGICSL